MGYTWRKEAGTWIKVNSMFRKESGAWEPVKSAFQKVSGTHVNVFDSEVVVEITTNQTDLVLKSLFSSEDWDSGKAKTVHIHSGVTVSPSSLTYALIPQPASDTTIWGGVLTVINEGIIQGKGGAANSGVGGNALYIGTVSNSTKKLQIKNLGTIRAGGGGAGRGGTGGGGQYNYTATEGPYYSSSYGWWQNTNSLADDADGIKWGGSRVFSGNWSNTSPPTSVTIGIYTYNRGAQQSVEFSVYNYAVSRSYTATATTSGGAGGNGGRGQGSDGANASGSAGAAGGTNAGTGGTGGTGGTWGNSGATGFTGSSGNRTAGTAGTAGGVAGYAYSTALHNIVVPGIILGRVA
ncbi:hypothetical protein PP749_gp087 [Rhizobium phage RHEph22]|uniref:Uncharacterized protein n=1 Tax=Rhizobium phage RHEph22 TaxID=2836135 RepID=A0AAE7VN34_9CAUD|nr:hypothetical protein PP749_gp087 [Rhizobium phage RHEph22]QXV74760.1 hypothetical protein [Rhizobium phage RHEph22]QXV74856.1 hypothetical protein [Rhizobium phage RHEph24]